MQQLPLSRLVGDIDNRRQHANLSSATRLFILNFFRTRVRRFGKVAPVERTDEAR